ncbi:GDP-mannose mannosyl hydrolase [Burkholderia ubonensis]|uniref:GDP-mannose mannosyl hydrolase n=1 Tax=Burkholderia ubonensis TaxID=101571 RepID=UPI0039F58682
MRTLIDRTVYNLTPTLERDLESARRTIAQVRPSLEPTAEWQTVIAPSPPPATNTLTTTMLDHASFLQVIGNSPLISIDLIVPDGHGHFLLGRRTNQPAKGYWFVPGGRIRKNERMNDAYRRLCDVELGLHNLELADATLQGVYEHFYDSNFAGVAGLSTHYVVLAYELPSTPIDLGALPPDQHTDYRWVAPVDLLEDETVHHYTKAYFR